MQLRSATQLGCIRHAFRVSGSDSLCDLMPRKPEVNVTAPLGLTIIGTGPVAQVLGRLFGLDGRLIPHQVVGRSHGSAARLGASLSQASGQAPAVYAGLERLDRLQPVVMIVTPDRSIRHTAEALALHKLIKPGCVVFHCSGGLGSEALVACADQGAVTASAHPLASFADPMRLAADFADVYCATEGDARALDVIEPAFQRLGAQVVRLSTGLKMAYHAGAVLASGYLLVTLTAAIRAEQLAGLAAKQASDMLAPLIRMTVENALREGTLAAMTGPLVRGDDALVRAHLATLAAHDPALADFYAALTRYASTLLSQADPLARPDDHCA